MKLRFLKFFIALKENIEKWITIVLQIHYGDYGQGKTLSHVKAFKKKLYLVILPSILGLVYKLKDLKS